MPTTRDEAYETCRSEFETGWNAGAVNIVATGFTPSIRWDGYEVGEIPKDAFCRFKMQWVLERQRTFRNGDEIGGNARYVSAGLIFVQVFAPRKSELAETHARQLATVARNIFRGKTFDGCILFRNVRVVDANAEQNFRCKVAQMEFEYDEIS